jgi:hypothetical protein
MRIVVVDFAPLALQELLVWLHLLRLINNTPLNMVKAGVWFLFLVD